MRFMKLPKTPILRDVQNKLRRKVQLLIIIAVLGMYSAVLD
jgi:hypothetical protein